MITKQPKVGNIFICHKPYGRYHLKGNKYKVSGVSISSRGFYLQSEVISVETGRPLETYWSCSFLNEINEHFELPKITGSHLPDYL